MYLNVRIVWFKRDLRLYDHAPLVDAVGFGGLVIPLYIVEPEYWQQPFAARRHWHFIHDCLVELRADCTALGQPLMLCKGSAVEVFDSLSQRYGIDGIHAHEETGNGWTYARDKAVLGWCKSQAIPFHEYPANGVVRRLANRDGWAKIRNERMVLPRLPKPQSFNNIAGLVAGDILAKDDPVFGDAVPGITQLGGRRAAIGTLKSFLLERGETYVYRLSAPGPSHRHCSRLSPHLAWGTLSVREVLAAIKNRRAGLSKDEAGRWGRNLSAFASRLSWRCHFVQKIEDQPAIEFAAMHPAFEAMRDYDPDNASDADMQAQLMAAWASGNTGYPLIDACMRALIHDGWINFRMRAMLVSFASYHLWLDWRQTGYHLARLFTDYEPGIHYSQLQMQSGVTGINALRIYNPIKQSQEQDPNGDFIRRFVPELANVSNSWIHTPWKMDAAMQEAASCVIGRDYPAPIIDHAAAVKSARENIAAVRAKAGFKDQAKKVYQKLGSRKKSSAKGTAKKQSMKRASKAASSQLQLF